MTDHDILKAIWRGGTLKLPTYLHPDESVPELLPMGGPKVTLGAAQVESLLERGVIERQGKTWMSGEKYRLARLTDLGRNEIDAPTQAEIEKVVVSEVLDV